MLEARERIMASWKEERDRLVAQALAFVQQVATAHPAAASKLGLVSAKASTEIDGASLSPALDINAAPKGADGPVAAITSSGDDVGNIPVPTDISADLPKHTPRYSAASDRSDIAQRVAIFRARQVTLNREREAYYISVQTRIRASLQNDPDSGRL